MEQHDYIVLLEKFFKKEASSEERRILIEWIRKPGIRNEFNLLCEQMWKEAAVEIDKTVEEEMWNHLQRNLDEPKILSPKKRRWQPIIYKVAATILLPVCLGLATYFVTTLLAEGSVKVSNKTDVTLLKPGEKVEYHKSKQTFTKSVISDMREIDFWRNNMLIFNSSSLAEIATTLERMYGVKVVFDSEKLKNVLFSGTIRNSSLHNVFYIISLTYPLTYELEGDTVRIGSSIN